LQKILVPLFRTTTSK